MTPSKAEVLMVEPELVRQIGGLAAQGWGAKRIARELEVSRSRYMVALINRQGGSDCETLALGFKEFGLGPVIGTRTWGGWVASAATSRCATAAVTEPEFGGWDPRGKEWRIEGHGVDPDVALDLDPDGLIHGHALQLDRAIAYLLEQIAKDPRDLPAAPPIPLQPLRPAN